MKKKNLFLCILTILLTASLAFSCVSPILAEGETETPSGDLSVNDETLADTVLSFDSRNSYFKNAGNEMKTNGITLGKNEGINLQASTEYTVTFEYCFEDIVPVSDNTDYNTRTTFFGYYPGGTSNGVDATWVKRPDGNSILWNPWDEYNATGKVGKWAEYAVTFTTNTSFSGFQVFAFKICGGVKASIRNFRVKDNTNNTDEVLYSFGKMSDLPTSANIVKGDKVYNNENRTDGTGRTHPEVIVTTGATRALTIDLSDSNYYGKTNGIILGEKQGIYLESGKEYKVEFQYRLDERVSSAENTSLTYITDVRNTAIAVYKDGANSTEYPVFISDAADILNGNKNRLVPHNFTLGIWYNLGFSFKTTTLTGTDYLRLESYAGHKCSYRNLKITDTETGLAQYCDLSTMKDFKTMRDGQKTYIGIPNDPNSEYPEINVTQEIPLFGDANSDNNVDICDLVRIKLALTDRKSVVINYDCADLDGVEGLSDKDFAAIRTILLNK